MPVLQDRLAAALAPRYTVDRELAAGGMGLVFLGHDPVLGREVAIKVLPPEHATAVAIERFQREARLLARLAHPHVVPVLEAQRDGDLLWFVMPRIVGDTLAHRLAEGPLPAEQVRRIGVELADALAHAHANGVVHRDIKPANVFLQGDHVLLADFGVALLRERTDDSLTAAGHVVGTLRYMAPEQRTGGEATERSDVYALAATLYEAATGRQWNPAQTGESSPWRSMPAPLAAVLRRALHFDPAQRWRDAASFGRALAGAARTRYHRALLVAVPVTALVALMLMFRANRPQGALRLAHADLVVLRFAGDSGLLATQLSRATTTPLEWFPPLSVVEWSATDQLDELSGRHLARFVVTGAVGPIVRDSGVVRVEVRDSSGGRRWAFPIAGKATDVTAWGRAIADSLVALVAPAQRPEFRQVGGANANMDALDAFYQGDSLFERGDWTAARARYLRADSLDPALVMPRWKALLALQWNRLPFQADLVRLATQADLLPKPLGALVRLQLEPDLDRRLAGFAAIAQENQGYPWARLLYANELFHRGALVGHSLREGVDALAQGAAGIRDLDNINSYQQIIWGAARLGLDSLTRSQLERRSELANDDWQQLLHLATESRFRPLVGDVMRWVMIRFKGASLVGPAWKVARIGLNFDDPYDQLAFGRLLATATRSPNDTTPVDSLRASGHAAEATAFLLLGEPTRALAQLDSAAACLPGAEDFQLQPAEWRVLLPSHLVGVPVADGERNAGRRALAAVPESAPLWPRAAWALIVDAISRGDTAVATQWRVRLHARAATNAAAAELAAYADAFALGAAGHLDSALVLSRRIHRDPPDSIASARGPFLRAVVYVQRGEWLRDQHRVAAADSEWIWYENNDLRGWPQGEPQEGELDAALSGVARARRADNLQRSGPAQAALACQLLDRVRELWRDAEVSFRPLQARVEAGRRQCPG